MEGNAMIRLGLVQTLIEEAKKKGEPDPVIPMKGEPVETLVAVLDWAMTDLTVTNPSVLFNVRHLITPYNTMDDEFFKSKDVWFTDIEQLLDVKIALAKQIKTLQVKVVQAYFACLKSLHKVEFTYLDNTVEIEPAVRTHLAWMTLIDMSKLIDSTQAKDIDPVLQSKAYVKDAMGILAPMVLNAGAMLGMVNLWSQTGGKEHAEQSCA